MSEYIEIRHGKYLDQVTTKLPDEDIILSKCGPISRQIEPGEVNFPVGETFSITLDNLDPAFNQKYPLQYWIDNSRSQEEGAIQDLQIYVEVKISGTVQFIGTVNKVSYSKWDAECTVEIAGITELLRLEKRSMFKSFAFDTFIGFFLSWDKPLHSLDDQVIDIKMLQFDLHERIALNDYPEMNFPIYEHLGWLDPDPPSGLGSGNPILSPNRDITRSAFVQIGEVTLLTRIRFMELYQITEPPLSGPDQYRRRLRAYVWHRNDPVTNEIIPRGRFIDGNGFIEENAFYQVIIHEPDLGNTPEAAVKVSDLPLEQNWIIGCPFIDEGSNYKIVHAEYESINVLSKIQDIINNDIADRHLSEKNFEGFIEITDSAASGPSYATATLNVNYVPFINEKVVVKFTDSTYSFVSDEFLIKTSDTIEDISAKIADVINTEINYFSAVVDSNDPSKINIFADLTGSLYNNYSITVGVDQYPSTPLYGPAITSGGYDGFVSGPISLLIGGSVFASTANVVASETASSIAFKIYLAAIAVGSSDYQFEHVGNKVLVSTGTIKQHLDLETHSTGVKYQAYGLESAYSFFNTQNLLQNRWQYAFVADIAMYSWVGKTVIESLISSVIQTGSYMFTTNNGMISIASRDYHQHAYLQFFQPILLQASDVSINTGTKYDGGFSSYGSEIYVDVIEINNVKSRQKRKIYADKNGSIDEASLKHKEIKLENYRVGDLGVPMQDDPVEQPVLRYTPGSSNYPFTRPLDHFIPAAQSLLNVIASTRFFPNREVGVSVTYPNYTNLELGSYVLYRGAIHLIKSFELDPSTQIASLGIEFKKEGLMAES